MKLAETTFNRLALQRNTTPPLGKVQSAPRDVFSSSADNPEILGEQLREMSLTSGLDELEESRSFPDREGYDKNFLGVPLGLPKLSDELRAKAAPLLDDPDKIELEYTNYSAIVHSERRQPILTAVNIDGKNLVDLPRVKGWATDSRIAREHQLGNEAYTRNPWDRGHMVRRSDAVWGPDASQANRDTFVYTNASLQHKDLNQKEWLELENHIISHARNEAQRLTVFTGPVLAQDDPKFDNKGRVSPATQIPQEFWKVAVWKDDETGKLRGTGFVLSQREFVQKELGGIFQNELPIDRFAVYQVPLEELQEKTGLDFGDVQDVIEQRQPVDKVDSVKT